MPSLIPRLSLIIVCLHGAGFGLRGQITIDTFAGGKIPSGIPAQNAFLQSVSGITRDPSGRIVFTDSQQNVIRRINADGTVQTIAGQGIPGFGGDGGPAASALLYGPAFPAYDAVGNLYFADTGNYRIRRIDAAGKISTVAGTGIAANTTIGLLGENGPATLADVGNIGALALDPAGNIYITEGPYVPIRRITPSGTIESYVSCPCGYAPQYPLASDSSGDLYVSDGNHIVKITPDQVGHKFAGFGNAPNNGNGGPAINAPPSNFIALAADASGNVYTEEVQGDVNGSSGQFIIREIDTNGIINVVAGTFTGGSYSGGSFNDGPALQVALVPGYGSGMFPEANGVLTFAEDFRIRQLTAQSTVQTIAGGQAQYPPDGTTAPNAWFIEPAGIAFDPLGNLYVAQACAIQKITPNGVLSTVIGTSFCAQGDSIASIAVDGQGQVYFSLVTGAIYLVSGTGAPTLVPGTPVGGVIPLLAEDSQDLLYFVAYPGISGRLVSGSLHYINQIPTGAGSGIAVDSAGNVYICCDGAHDIDKYSPDLTLTRLGFGQRVPLGQNGLAVDASGTIWQGSTAFGMLKGALPFGAGCCNYGDGGAAESANILPSGMAFAPNGDLYFLDTASARVRRIHGSPPAIAPSISAGGIVNAASLAGGAIAPGELISIFGSNFGPAGLDVAAPQNNVMPDALANVHVLINGVLARISARTPDQINVFVPYEVARSTSAQMIVDVDSVTSQPVTVPVAPAAFGLSTADGSGTGQGAILNQDGSYNSASNPAARGTIVTLFGTGEGVTSPALPDGALEISTPYSAPTLPVTVKFGDQTAQVPYAGAAPFLPTGVFQIDAAIPMEVAPGNVPISVSIGGIATTRDVTVAVK